MKIGDASRLTGLPTKTLRYYEGIGLISSSRAGNGYREYSETQVETLRFLARTRGLGFNIEECRSLIGLYQDQTRKSSDVRKITLEHIAAIDKKMLELNAVRNTLSGLVNACRGDERPDCPILEGLSAMPSAAK